MENLGNKKQDINKERMQKQRYASYGSNEETPLLILKLDND